MKHPLFSFTTLLAAALLLGAGCGKTDTPSTAENDYEPLPPMPAELVQMYMDHTLGTLPNADIDYDEAKTYLTDDLRAQFQTPAFVPASYCIQDGPEDVKIVSDKIGEGGSVHVDVDGLYGDAWQNMWRFYVVPDGNYGWLIEKIECL
jgi:hypothetical protein